MDAEKITHSNGKRAVARKIKEQIEAVGVHVAHQRSKTPAAGGRLQPVLFNQCGDDEFVKESPKNAVHRAIEIDKKFIARSRLSPFTCEALEAVNWPR